jgi:hypothetical protein
MVVGTLINAELVVFSVVIMGAHNCRCGSVAKAYCRTQHSSSFLTLQ